MKYHTKDLLLAAAFGWLSGHRSMAGPAIVGRKLIKNPNVGRALAAAAAGEMVFDKHPDAPDRNDLQPLIGRTLAGAAVGAVIAASGSGRLRRTSWVYTRHVRRFGRHHASDVIMAAAAGAVVGGTAAFISTHASYHLRRWVRESTDAPNGVLGVAEDAVVYGAGMVLGRQLVIPTSET